MENIFVPQSSASLKVVISVDSVDNDLITTSVSKAYPLGPLHPLDQALLLGNKCDRLQVRLGTTKSPATICGWKPVWEHDGRHDFENPNDFELHQVHKKIIDFTEKGNRVYLKKFSEISSQEGGLLSYLGGLSGLIVHAAECLTFMSYQDLRDCLKNCDSSKDDPSEIVDVSHLEDKQIGHVRSLCKKVDKRTS